MRVMILSESLVFGGINRYCVDLADGLRAYKDVRCDLAAFSNKGDDWLLQEASVRGLEVEVFRLSSVGKLRNLLINRRIDILHSQGYRSNIPSRLVIHLGRLPTKSICTIHGVYHFATAAWRSKFYFLADYLSMRLSHWFITVSTATQRKVARWAGRKRITTIHNGTLIPELPNEAEKFACRQALGLPYQAKIICFIGRFSPQKGISALIDVAYRTARITPNAIFVIVGDGPLKPEIESCARKLGMQMRLVGSQRDVRTFYLASDVLLLPSCTEGLPMTLIEAFAHGLPAVASNVGGIPEVLTDGYNGFLCESNDTASMSQRLFQLLQQDELRLNFGINARKTVESHYSLSSMVEATYQVYQQLVNEA